MKRTPGKASKSTLDILAAFERLREGIRESPCRNDNLLNAMLDDMGRTTRSILAGEIAPPLYLHKTKTAD